LPNNIQLKPGAADDLPVGIVALEGEALYRGEPDWSGMVYRELKQ
jgi:hypothetical protein